ncbi:phage gp6-like head-tail connector protein [Listeria fleischmannii]|uniref:phage gp6-like head-tail connector protein n=1 Tax=Listeria fleischmannii TaxID=1069827 RepID=UPI003B968A58
MRALVEIITPELLTEFKARNRISHSSEDEAFIKALRKSYLAICSKCGIFNPSTDEQGAELVFERTRYVLNDALEYFDRNFSHEMLDFSLELEVKRREAEEETADETF